MAKPVTVGIIGLGRWGTNYLRTFSGLPDAQVVWICSRTEQTLQGTLGKVKLNSVPKTTTDPNVVFADPAVAAVAIVTPARTHAALTKAALLANKDVLVEKPFTLSLKEAQELVRLAEQRKRILMVGHIHCFNPAIRKLKEDILAGEFGAIRSLRCDLLHNESSRRDAGALWDMMPHALSIFAELLGTQPYQVSAHGDEDAITLTLSYPNDLTAIANGRWSAPHKILQVEVTGVRQAVFDEYAESKLRYDGVSQAVPRVAPLTAELQHFLDCIRMRAGPRTSGKQALPLMRILDAAQRSLEQHGAAIKMQIFHRSL